MSKMMSEMMYCAPREAARARKLSGAAVRQEGGYAARARGPGTPDNDAGRGSSGLHSIAAALDEASPFPVKQEAAAFADEEQFYDSDDEVPPLCQCQRF